MREVNNIINEQLIAEFGDRLQEAFRNEKRQRLVFLRTFAEVQSKLLEVGNDKGGACAIIINQLHKVRPELQMGTLDTYWYAAKVVHIADIGGYGPLGIEKAEQVPMTSYSAIAANGRAWVAQMNAEYAEQQPEEEPKSNDSWIEAFAAFHDGQARLHEELATRLRGLL